MNARHLLASVAIASVTLAGLTACDMSSSGGGGNAQASGQELTETAFQKQQSAVPYPASQMTDSLERRNLSNRLTTLNKPNLLQYVYILSMTGSYVGYYAIKGKVSSTQSQMTTDQLIEPCSQGGDSGSGNCAAVVNAPGDDGSYGAEEPGIFFYTTEGILVETSMQYLVADAPLPVNAPKLNPTAAPVGK